MPLQIDRVRKLSESILQIGNQIQCLGYPTIAKCFLEIKQTQCPFGCRVTYVPIAPVILPAKNCPLGRFQQERKRSLLKFKHMTKEPDFSSGEIFPGCHKPVTDCLMQSLDVKDLQASIFQCVVIDKVDAVKSAFRVVVCLGHRIFLLKNSNNRASANLQYHDYLDIPSSHLALQFAPEVAMIVFLGSVNDSSNTQC